MPWTEQDVVNPGQRPGSYVNFERENDPAAVFSTGGTTGGVVAAIVTAAWGPTVDNPGPDGAVVSIRNTEDIRRHYTMLGDNNDNKDYFVGVGAAARDIEDRYSAPVVLKSLLEGGAREIRAIRVVGTLAGSGDGHATKTIQNTEGTPVDALKLTAKYPGVGGNAFEFSVSDTPNVVGSKRLTIWDPSNNVIGRWDGATVADIVTAMTDNIYFDATAEENQGTTTLADVDRTSFTGGDGKESGLGMGNYKLVQPLLEIEDFEFLYLATNTSDIISDFGAWINNQKDQGKMRIMVVGSALSADVDAGVTDGKKYNDPSITYIWPGMKRNDLSGVARTYPGYIFAAKLTGLFAGLPFTSSPTYKSVEGIVDLETRPSNSDVKKLLAAGITPVVYTGRRFRVESGLTTYDQVNSVYRKIKTTRIVYAIVNKLNRAVDDEDFIGEYDNSPENQDAIIAGFRQSLQEDVDAKLILSNFVVELDPANPPYGDKLFVRVGLQPIDSIDFVYFTVAIG